MNKILSLLVLMAVAVAAPAQKFTVKVTNTSAIDRHDVPVVVDLHKALGKKVATILSAEVIAPNATSRTHGAGILVPCQLDDLDGDLIFARQQQTAEPGQMIVAQVEDEATVKYFHPEKNGVRLEPANSAYKPIWVPEDKNFSIAGLVIGVLRKFN